MATTNAMFNVHRISGSSVRVDRGGMCRVLEIEID